MGLLGENVPKHAKVYVNSQKILLDGIKKYKSEVENNTFPNTSHVTTMDIKELNDLKNKIENL